MLNMLEKKDPRITKGYSLHQSKHEALRKIAVAKGGKKASASELLDRIVEQWLRNRFGPYWEEELDRRLADEARYAIFEEERIA